MNPTERRAYTKKAKESGPMSQTLSTLSISHTQSGISGIPESILSHQFSKAQRLLRMNKVRRGFGVNDTLLVASDTSAKPHVIRQCKNGTFCYDDDCPAYNHSSLCAHTLAGVEFKGKLIDFVTWHQKTGVQTSVTKMCTYGLDVGSDGKKPHQRKRAKKTKGTENFNVEHVDRLQTPSHNRQPVKMKIVQRNGEHEVLQESLAQTDEGHREGINSYSLVFLSDHPRVTTCTGCGIKFARKADGGLFPPPHDVAITHKEHRPWKDRNTGILRVGKEQAVYFHVNISCVQKGNSISRATFDGAQLDIHPIVKQRLNKEHKDFLFQQLNISL